MQTTHRQRRGADNKYHINIWHDTSHITSYNTSHQMTHTHTKHPSIIHAVVLNQVLWNSMIHSSLPCTLPSPGLESEAPEILIWGEILRQVFPSNSGCSTDYSLLQWCNATVLLKIPKHHSCIISVIQNNHKGRLCQQNNCQLRGVSTNTTREGKGCFPLKI